MKGMKSQNGKFQFADIQAFAFGGDLSKPLDKREVMVSHVVKTGGHVDKEKWVEIAASYMLKMGFSEQNQRAYVLHDDADAPHIHIVATS